jgi:predicted ArsR family transcriptional regulator
MRESAEVGETLGQEYFNEIWRAVRTLVMSSDFIPEDVEQFILKRITSVAQLEALLLLRSNDQVDWSVDAVAKRLYVRGKLAREILRRLMEEGFLIAGSGRSLYRYQPTTSELREIVDRLAESYSKHLLPITNIIHSKPQTRVQEFADAFKLRKDE